MRRFSTLVVLSVILCCSTIVSAAQINLANRQWTLLAVPANTEATTIESLFGDDLPIDSLGSDWSIYRFDQAAQNFNALGRNDSLRQGEGFWMIQTTGSDITIDVPDSLPDGSTVTSNACASTNGCFHASLPVSASAPGWAIVGAPFDQPVNVGDIRVQSSEPSCADGCTLADSSGTLLGGQWLFDTNSNRYQQLTNLTSLQPWQAFWIATAPTSSSEGPILLLPAPTRTDEPGAVIETHHETIPNPVHNSTFRVASACKRVTLACDWNNANTWQSGSVPNADSRVIVDGRVQIRDQRALARSIGIYPGGELSFDPNSDTQLQTADLLVLEGGTLEIGTEYTPIDSANQAQIVFRDLPFDGNDSEQHLRGLLALDGVVRVFGHALNNTYLRTAIEPKAGETEITLTQSAVAAGWRVGDAVVIPASHQCYIPSGNGVCPDHTEDRTITSVSADGLRVTLNQALAFDHPGARSHAGTLDFTPHVINKARNVIFRSENPNSIRAHMLFHGRADINMRYASVSALGRSDIRNLGPTNQKGRYPVHAHHLIGPQSPQANGYQFTFIGNVVDFGTENRDQDRKWGVTIHGSHFGLIEHNIVDYASGAGIVTESGSEMGNLFRENFVVRVIGGNGERTRDPDPSDGSKLGRAGTGFWFNGGGRNQYERNVAAAVIVDDCVYCYGFKFDNVYNGDLLFPMAQGDDPHMNNGETVSADAIGMNHFVDNEAYSVPNGLTVWWLCTFGMTPNNNCSSRIDSFRVWHHHRWGYYGYPVNNLTLDNFIIRGEPSVLSNRYVSTVGIQTGDYFHRNLLISNADIQNVRNAVQMPTVRDEAGATGPDVGINTIEDSYLVATEGIGVWAPVSVNRDVVLPPQTTIIRNVQFDYPIHERSDRLLSHIEMHDDSIVLGAEMNLTLRNDVKVYNYNQAPGASGDSFYIVPGYQGPARCDNTIAVCGSELTVNYSDINKGHIYPLR